MRSTMLALVLLPALGVAAACGPDGGAAAVHVVPTDHPSIQAAVDAATPGDLVLVEPGEYHERVVVATEGVTLRGRDRNGVVLDGGHELIDGVVVTADGVAVENLTVRNYRQNGVIVNGAGGGREPGGDGVYGIGDDTLSGYRVSYVTAANNGTYGIYAFAATNGLIEHSLASGSPDSGIYVGQCRPCDVVVRDSIAEYNAIGYYGTNASGGVYVIDSVFRHNRLGMTPNSQDNELLAPQIETVIAGNLVHDNDEQNAPAIARGFFGGGIVVGGGTSNVVLRNRVSGHDLFGIGLVRLNEFDPIDNRVEGNLVDDNALDLYFESVADGTSSYGNCFVGNGFVSSLPLDIEEVLACDGSTVAVGTAIVDPLPAPPNVDYREIPLPPDQPVRPGDAATPPSEPASFPGVPDLDAIAVPEAP